MDINYYDSKYADAKVRLEALDKIRDALIERGAKDCHGYSDGRRSYSYVLRVDGKKGVSFNRITNTRKLVDTFYLITINAGYAKYRRSWGFHISSRKFSDEDGGPVAVVGRCDGIWKPNEDDIIEHLPYYLKELA